MSNAKILVVEDDPDTLRTVTAHLQRDGFLVRGAADSRVALKEAYDFRPDLVVLDIDLPNPSGESLDGLRLLEILREESETPVVMLTATSSPSVKVYALTIGADDYVTKPFDVRELVARIRAILKRAGLLGRKERTLSFRRLTIDPDARRVWKDGKEVNLTPLEFDILLVLARRPGWVFSRSQLIRGAWKFDRYGDERVVDTHISHLRQKIEEDASHPELILTVHGAGYRFEDQPKRRLPGSD